MVLQRSPYHLQAQIGRAFNREKWDTSSNPGNLGKSGIQDF